VVYVWTHNTINSRLACRGEGWLRGADWLLSVGEWWASGGREWCERMNDAGRRSG
jgi:hypothetical protein